MIVDPRQIKLINGIMCSGSSMITQHSNCLPDRINGPDDNNNVNISVPGANVTLL